MSKKNYFKIYSLAMLFVLSFFYGNNTNAAGNLTINASSFIGRQDIIFYHPASLSDYQTLCGYISTDLNNAFFGYVIYNPEQTETVWNDLSYPGASGHFLIILLNPLNGNCGTYAQSMESELYVGDVEFDYIFDACGDVICFSDENCNTCAADCGYCCPNTFCDFGETCATCPADCGGTCPACPATTTCPFCDIIATGTNNIEFITGLIETTNTSSGTESIISYRIPFILFLYIAIIFAIVLIIISLFLKHYGQYSKKNRFRQ